MADISFHLTGAALWQRMNLSVQKVQERLKRTTSALQQAGIPYAVLGDAAVQAWVAQADEAAVRTTRDVEVLLRRTDFLLARTALEAIGFVYRHEKIRDLFLDDPNAKVRDAVQVIFANERRNSADTFSAPDVSETEEIENLRVATLEALVRMQLIAFRDKDRMHIRDMIDVELIDASWCARFPPELASRLQLLLDTPNG